MAKEYGFENKFSWKYLKSLKKRSKVKIEDIQVQIEPVVQPSVIYLVEESKSGSYE